MRTMYSGQPLPSRLLVTAWATRPAIEPAQGERAVLLVSPGPAPVTLPLAGVQRRQLREPEGGSRDGRADGRSSGGGGGGGAGGSGWGGCGSGRRGGRGGVLMRE